MQTPCVEKNLLERIKIKDKWKKDCEPALTNGINGIYLWACLKKWNGINGINLWACLTCAGANTQRSRVWLAPREPLWGHWDTLSLGNSGWELGRMWLIAPKECLERVKQLHCRVFYAIVIFLSFPFIPSLSISPHSKGWQCSELLW